MHLQSGLPGSRNHSEVCRSRIEDMLSKDDAEMSFKQQANARLENQLTRALEREDELISETRAPTEG